MSAVTMSEHLVEGDVPRDGHHHVAGMVKGVVALIEDSLVICRIDSTEPITRIAPDARETAPRSSCSTPPLRIVEPHLDLLFDDPLLLGARFHR